MSLLNRKQTGWSSRPCFTLHPGCLILPFVRTLVAVYSTPVSHGNSRTDDASCRVDGRLDAKLPVHAVYTCGYGAYILPVRCSEPLACECCFKNPMFKMSQNKRRISSNICPSLDVAFASHLLHLQPSRQMSSFPAAFGGLTLKLLCFLTMKTLLVSIINGPATHCLRVGREHASRCGGGRCRKAFPRQ